MPLFGPNIKKMKEGKDVEGLTKVLKSENPKVRIEVVEALGELRNTKGLIEALRNDDPQVRVGAISVLGYEPEAKEALLHILKTDDVEAVWQAAFEALGTFGINDEKVWMNVATELLKKKRYENALICFDRATEISGDRKTISSIGEALTENERYEDALRYFDRYIETDRNDPSAWASKGLALFNLHRNEEAMVCCKKALDIDPKLKGAAHTLLVIYETTGEYEALAPLARQILRFDPQDVKAHVALAEALALSDRLNEAEATLQETLESLHKQEWMKSENLGMIHEALGVLYAMKGDMELVFANLQKAYGATRSEWHYQLQESYGILEVLGLTLKGTPRDRRDRLLALSLQRAEAKRYESIAERLIATTPISEIDTLAEGTGSLPGLAKAMLRFWSKEHFAEFVRIRSRREIEAMEENVGRLLLLREEHTDST